MKVITALGFVLGAAASMGSAWGGPVDREHGPSLVTNGGFENSTTVAGSGWTASGFQLEGYDYGIDTNPADARAGNASFAGGAIGNFGFLSQNLATVAGTTYNIHLSLANLSGFADGTAFEVLWGGNVVYSATDILGFNYVDLLIDPVATASSTTLSLGLRDDNFALNVDAISVRAVPEPEVLALLAAGLGIGALARRRRPRD